MRQSRAVAVFTTDRELRESRIGESSVALRNRIRTSAVAGNTAWQNWTVKSCIAQLVSGRQLPAPSLRIKGKRRLKNVIAAFDQTAKAVFAGSDDPLQITSI